MPKIINTMRFLEWGQIAPKNSRFKGVITTDKVFGKSGWMDYTGRKDAIDEKTEKGIDAEGGFINYTSREDAKEGLTMSSIGFLTPERRKQFKELGREAFAKKGDLLWDMVISLESYQFANDNLLNNQTDYAAAISKILPQFFRSVGLNPNNMLWWEDFHNNKEHPHMHVCFLEIEKTRTRGKFTAKEIASLKRIITKELGARQAIKEATGLGYEEFFQKKDEEKKELIESLKRIDLSQIKDIQSLARILPKKGRLQYGSYQVKDYRSAIDAITNNLLHSEELKESFNEYSEMLDTLAKTMNEVSGDNIATIKDRELQKLYKEIGNIILKDIKESHYSEEREKYYSKNGEVVDKTIHNHISSHLSSSKIDIRMEISAYLQGDDNIHNKTTRVDDEIDAYLNDKKTTVKRVR